MRDDRKELGYGENDIPDYVIDCSDKNEYTEVMDDVDKCDAVIIGSAPEKIVENRRKNNNIILRYSERPLKNGNSLLKYVHRWNHLRKVLPMGEYVYMLCSSGYTSADLAKFGMYKRKCYKWGYFPECKKYNDIESLIKAKNRTQILWCGRFLDWKHPDDVIEVAKVLKDKGYTFSLNFIGTGPLEDKMQQLIMQYGLNDCVRILGSMKPSEVRQQMEKSGIYLFTSDRQEGWGAVLNESMNSGCAVVASHAIGSVPFLIKDKENGLVYKSENLDDLCKKISYLLDNPFKQIQLGLSAYKTITEEWNAQVATNRLLDLINHIKKGEKSPDLFKSGPCSIAEIIKDNWYK